ncbi:MAG: GFA family protein [Pseudomonadota bacterium]|jgi:hypothetical protein|nr:GFA family protein [Pseudomonadota bacterium]
MFPLNRLGRNGAVREFTITSEAGTAVTREFCPACGGLILSRNDGSPDHATVPLGLLDDSAGFEPEGVIFARNRRSWDIMDGAISTFDDQPKWSRAKPA